MPPQFNLTQIIQQLRTSWGGSFENDTYPLRNSTVHYAILTSPPNDPSSPENDGWQPMTALMAQRAAEAFELWDDLIAINLTPYGGNPPAGAEIIQFGYSSTTDGGGTYEFPADGVFQGANEYGGNEWGITRAEIWLNSNWSTHGFGTAIDQPGYGYYGGYGFNTYLHEIGHAMGLSHPGSYNAGEGAITYDNSAEYLQDTHRYSLMSYFFADEDGSGTDHWGSSGAWRYPQTPMLHDIAAVQAIYGADTTTRTGNTTYGFNSNTGKDVFDFTRNANPIVTIYDAGGVDTLDLSGFGPGQYSGQVIDLTAGNWSDVGGYMTNNVAIAFGTIIENAFGGTGHDTLVGNSVANMLRGGLGNDILNGGTGLDSALFSGLRFAYTLTDLGGGNVQVAGPDGTDTLSSIEWLVFSDQTLGWPLSTNHAPTITSNGAGAAATLSHPENTTVVTTVTATDPDAGTTLAFSIIGGSDQGKFSINASSGLLSFVAAPDFEAPTDSDANNSYVVQVRASDGSLFDTQTITVNVTNAAEAMGSAVAGDFNGDGKSDALLRNSQNGAVITWEFNGAGGFASDGYGGANLAWRIGGVGDFDADGKSDILWRNSANGAVATWELNGAGGIGFNSYGAANLAWSVVGTGDFNADGKSDILWRDTTNGAVATWELNGGGGFSFDGYGAANLAWEVAGTGDFNGDGRSDILWRNTTSGAVATWELNGGEGFSFDSYGAASLVWEVAGTGDFNDDGKSDVLWRNNNGSVATWELNGAGGFTYDSYGTASTGWTIVGTGDFNDDGKGDILWRSSSDVVVTWELNGAGGFSVDSYGLASSPWHVFDDGSGLI